MSVPSANHSVQAGILWAIRFGLILILSLTMSANASNAATLGVYGDGAFTQTSITVAANTSFTVYVAMKMGTSPDAVKGVAWSIAVPNGLTLLQSPTFPGATLGSLPDTPGQGEYYWFTASCPTGGAMGDIELAQMFFRAGAPGTVSITPGKNSREAPTTYLTCDCIEVVKQPTPVEFQSLEVVIQDGGSTGIPALSTWAALVASVLLLGSGIVARRRWLNRAAV